MRNLSKIYVSVLDENDLLHYNNEDDFYDESNSIYNRPLSFELKYFEHIESSVSSGRVPYLIKTEKIYSLGSSVN